jgi:hypothetical protein
VIGFMIEHFNLRDVRQLVVQDEGTFRKWEKAVKGLMVRVKYPKGTGPAHQRPKKVRGLIKEGARHSFEVEDGRSITVQVSMTHLSTLWRTQVPEGLLFENLWNEDAVP